MNQIISRSISICILSFGYLHVDSKVTPAQVIPDNTVNTQVERDGNTSEIIGGTTQGSNLFHSFEQFSVPNGNEAFFNNAGAIKNIFSRVTGGNISQINGLIRANGSANLFLINPNGIIFGRDAALDIGGSFYGSTAESIIFPEGEFSALTPEEEPILTISVPIGLSFEDNPADVVNNSVANEGRGLEVTPGNNITLLGGNVSLNNGMITASDGTINLGGIKEQGTVEINDNGSLSFPIDVARADVTLDNGSIVDVTSTGRGNININAGNLNMSAGEMGESLIIAGVTTNSTDSGAGDITISATDNIVIDNSLILNQVAEGAVGNAGDVSIATGSLFLKGGGIIGAGTFGRGNGGGVEIIAQDTISIEGQSENGSSASGVFSTVGSEAIGDAGEINIITGYLSLKDGGRIGAFTFGKGNRGAVKIVAQDTISIEGQSEDGFFISGIGSTVQEGAIGDAGEISIITGSLSLKDGGLIGASTFGKGDGGGVEIVAQDTISIEGQGGIGSTVQEGAIGDAGEISIITGSLSLKDGGLINASTFGRGNAGGVEIVAQDTISIEGQSEDGSSFSGIGSTVQEGAIGDAGRINIITGSLSLKDGGLINASTFGRGNAGGVEIVAQDTISIEGQSEDGSSFSGVFSTVQEGAIGDAGEISIITGSLSLKDAGLIGASTFGKGDGGGIEIVAQDTISIEGQDGIGSTVEKGAIGDAGRINIITGSLSLKGVGQINASTSGNGNAGGIEIVAQDTISIEGQSEDGFFPSGVFSAVQEGAIGDAGGVSITTGSLSLKDGGQIGASTFARGNGGRVEIVAQDTISIEGQGGIGSTVEEEAIGDAGRVNIITDSLFLKGVGQINADTSGNGNAGGIEIVAQDTISIEGQSEDGSFSSGVFSSVQKDAIGDAGNIKVTTGFLSLKDGGQIGAGTFGRGSGGEVEIVAQDTISIEGQGSDGSSPSGVFNSVQKDAIGNAGGMSLTTGSLSLRSGGRINVDAQGEGNAGELTIKANSLSLNKNAQINASTRFGQGGIVNLQIAENITLDNNSSISAQAFNNAKGGNLSINASLIITTPNQNNDLIASAEEGNGGNIKITSEGIFGFQQRSFNRANNTNDIDATSKYSVDGTVQINAPEVNLQQELLQSELELLTADRAIANSCLAGSNQQNSFTIGDNGGLPRSLDSEYSDVNFSLTGVGSRTPTLEQPPEALENNQQQKPSTIAAQKMIKTEESRIFLVAAPQKAESLFCQPKSSQ